MEEFLEAQGLGGSEDECRQLLERLDGAFRAYNACATRQGATSVAFEEAMRALEQGGDEDPRLQVLCAYILWVSAAGMELRSSECGYWRSTLDAMSRDLFLQRIKTLFSSLLDSETAQRSGSVTWLQEGLVFGTESSSAMKDRLDKEVPTSVRTGAFGVRMSLHTNRANKKKPGLCFFVVEKEGKSITSWPIIIGRGGRLRASGCETPVEADTLPGLLDIFVDTYADKARYFLTPRLLSSLASEPLPEDANAALLRCSEEYYDALAIGIGSDAD